MDKKNKTYLYTAYKRPISYLKTDADWKWKDAGHLPCKWTWKKSGIAIFTSEKIDLKTKTVRRAKEEHNIIMKGTIQQQQKITI